VAGRGEAPPSKQQGNPDAAGSGTGSSSGSSSGSGPLDPLEASVRQAAARLIELRQLNQELIGKVHELEAHLTARAGGASASVVADPAWEAGWAEIRRRVEALARHLEQLAASSAPS
jgi:hypothetical protein